MVSPGIPNDVLRFVFNASFSTSLLSDNIKAFNGRVSKQHAGYWQKLDPLSVRQHEQEARGRGESEKNVIKK